MPTHSCKEKPSSHAPDKEKGKKGRPSSCVFVASLDSGLKEDHLNKLVSDHFKQWGNLERVKVLRDNENRPYAFVQYTCDQDASKAIKEGHNTIINGRSIRCEPARVNRTLHLRTSSIRKPMESVMRALLGVYGEIEQLVAADQNNRPLILDSKSGSKQWFCKFAFREDAIRAYASLKSKPSWVAVWAQNLEAASGQEEDITVDRCSVFVGQLDGDVTEQNLNERFQRHGEICSLDLIKRPYKKFAFIKFKTETAAAAAVEVENHAVFKKWPMSVQYREIYPGSRQFERHRSGIPHLALAPPPVKVLAKRRVSKVLTHNPNREVSKGGNAEGGNSEGENSSGIVSSGEFPSGGNPSAKTPNQGNPHRGSPYGKVPHEGMSNEISRSTFKATACVKFEKETELDSPPSSPSSHSVHTMASSVGRSVYSASTVSHCDPMKNNYTHVGDFHPSVQMMSANMPCFYYVPRGFDQSCDPRGVPHLAPAPPFFNTMYDGFEGLACPPLYMWPQGGAPPSGSQGQGHHHG